MDIIVHKDFFYFFDKICHPHLRGGVHLCVCQVKRDLGDKTVAFQSFASLRHTLTQIGTLSLQNETHFHPNIWTHTLWSFLKQYKNLTHQMTMKKLESVIFVSECVCFYIMHDKGPTCPNQAHLLRTALLNMMYFWSGSNLKEALMPKSTLSFWVVSAYQVALYAFSMFKWTFP